MCSTHAMLTVLSNLSRSLSAVVHASVGASVSSLFLQACWFGDESSKGALARFALGTVGSASNTATSAARRAGSARAVRGEAAGPVQSLGRWCPQRLASRPRSGSCPISAFPRAPPAPLEGCQGREGLLGHQPGENHQCSGPPFQWRRLEQSRAAGQDTFGQFPFLTTG